MKKIFIWADPEQVNPHSPIEEQYNQSGCNFGNLLISHGALSLFPKELVVFPKHFKRPEEIQDVCSHVIYPAANILWKGFDMSSTYDYLRKTQLPIVMLGVGAQTNNRNLTSPINDSTLKLMQLVSERSASIGVRGYYTAEVLAAHGIHNTSILGCPSFYMNLRPSKIRPIGEETLSNISVNFSRRVNAHSFRPAVLKTLENILLQIGISSGADFVAQDELEELRLANGDESGNNHILKYFNEVPQETVIPFFRGHTRHFYLPTLWSDYISQRSLSIGSRFHGNIIALLNGTPAFFIIHDSRTMELSTLLGVPSIHVDDLQENEISDEFIKEKVQSANYDLFEKAHTCLFNRMKMFLKINNIDTFALIS